MKLNRREQLLGVAIGVIVLGLGTWGAASVLTGRWQAARRDIVTRQRELAAMRTAIMNAPVWQRQTDKLRAGLRVKTQHFEQMSDLLKQIEDTSKTAGVVISTRRPLPTIEHGSYRELSVQCSFEATTSSAIHFLYSLQVETGLISIEQIQLTPRPDNTSVLRGDIQLRAFTERKGKGAS